MKRSTLSRVVLPAAVVMTLGLSACGASNETAATPSASGSGGSSASAAPALKGTISGIGSSAQTAAVTAWKAGFEGTNPDATVNYDPQGSGAGRKQFLAGGADFAGTDAALKDTELAMGKTRCVGGAAIDIPVYVSPIALVYNLPEVKDLKLAPATAAGMFLGTIKTWNAPQIAADNPGVTLPSTAVTPVHRSDDSGTTQNFTEYLSATAPAVWTAKAAQTWPVKTGEAAAGTSGVISSVKAGAGSIGYADESQAAGLGQAQVKVGTAFVGPSADGAAAALTASKTATGRPTGDLAVTIDRTTTAAGAYPVILVSYAAVCTKYADAAKGDLVKAYMGYVVSADGQAAAAKSAGSAPLPMALATEAKTAVDSITSGS